MEGAKLRPAALCTGGGARHDPDSLSGEAVPQALTDRAAQAVLGKERYLAESAPPERHLIHQRRGVCLGVARYPGQPLALGYLIMARASEGDGVLS